MLSQRSIFLLLGIGISVGYGFSIVMAKLSEVPIVNAQTTTTLRYGISAFGSSTSTNFGAYIIDNKTGETFVSVAGSRFKSLGKLP